VATNNGIFVKLSLPICYLVYYLVCAKCMWCPWALLEGDSFCLSVCPSIILFAHLFLCLTIYLLLFSPPPLSELITQRVVVVVNLPSQKGTNCGQLYRNVYTHSHQNRHVKGLLSEKLRMPASQ
jgi:hypothetical protein